MERAGMVIGTPAWQRIGETAEQQWERENASDPNQKKYERAASSLQNVLCSMKLTKYLLMDIVRDLDGTPGEARVRSLLDGVEQLWLDTDWLMAGWKGDVR